ncbi:MAG: DNA-protecting protein DprA [Alphaproteobacteria bacterium]|nr:DNA-protecting protein DprA [Alphaproteobacteria bacterium]
MLPLFQKTKKLKDVSSAEKLAWLRLWRTENVGPATFYRLLDRYQSAETALAHLPDLAKRGGRAKPLKAPETGAIEKEYEALLKYGGDFICAYEENFPVILSTLDDAPPVLSYMGNISLLQKPCFGVVGARNASLNGRKFTEKLARDMGEAGYTVVSGLARGIDTAAHEGSLKTGTVAVLAGGLDVIYPPENDKLYKAIADKGLLITEQALSQPMYPQIFPKRNRIISGLSEGTIIVEATMKSGSMITARLAAEQGREVFAVPGFPLDPRAEGPNYLIRQGAKLATGAEDILQELQEFKPRINAQNLQQELQEKSTDIYINDNGDYTAQIYGILSSTPVTVDEIVRICQLSTGSVLSTLLDLELAGRILRLPGQRICRLENDA